VSDIYEINSYKFYIGVSHLAICCMSATRVQFKWAKVVSKV